MLMTLDEESRCKEKNTMSRAFLGSGKSIRRSGLRVLRWSSKQGTLRVVSSRSVRHGRNLRSACLTVMLLERTSRPFHDLEHVILNPANFWPSLGAHLEPTRATKRLGELCALLQAPRHLRCTHRQCSSQCRSPYAACYRFAPNAFNSLGCMLSFRIQPIC